MTNNPAWLGLLLEKIHITYFYTVYKLRCSQTKIIFSGALTLSYFAIGIFAEKWLLWQQPGGFTIFPTFRLFNSIIYILSFYINYHLLFFATYVICKKNYSFSGVVFLFFSDENCQLFLFKNK